MAPPLLCGVSDVWEEALDALSADRLSAVVLAGTHSWSGSTFERLGPRPLVPVALAPLVSYSLRWLERAGVRRVTICANGTTRAIEAALADSDFGVDLEYYKDSTPRGAAGCVRDAGLSTEASTLVVLDGTAVPVVDFEELMACHRASGAALTAVVHGDRHTPSAPPSPGGVYVFDRRVLDHVAGAGFQDIKENLIPRLRRAGERVAAYLSGGFCPHVLDARTYLAVNEWMLQRLAGESDGDHGPLVDADAFVDPAARLVGPVQLGPGVRVERGATIVGPTSIGPDSVVCRNALVSRSAVWSECVVGDGAVVHGCIVGDEAVVPSRTRLFNAVRAHEGRGPVAARPGSRLPASTPLSSLRPEPPPPMHAAV
jgi:NDP-sugar pyrophosphorylase family protein